MKHAKMQRSRNIVLLLRLIITSLTFSTLLSCGSNKDASKSRQPLNRTKSATKLKIIPINTKQPSGLATNNWVCASCGYANTKPNEVCIGCGLNKQDILNNIKNNNIKKHQVDTTSVADEPSLDSKHTSNSQKYKIILEGCPVCLEEDILADDLSLKCEQCKKLICVRCHRKMKKAQMNFCPLCRHKPKVSPKPKRRERSKSV